MENENLNNKIDLRQRYDVRALADFLDTKFKLPFGFRIGWDGIIGLIPGLGDLVTNGFSFYILLRSAQLGCPPSVILRMCLNIVIDNLVNLPPVIGHLFDFMWRSNTKNVQLLENYLQNSKGTVVRARFDLLITIVLVVAFFVAVTALAIWVSIWVWNSLKLRL